MAEANLAQVEFFHVNFDSEEKFFRDIKESYFDGLRMSLGGIHDHNPGFKTTVRFYDYSGELTEVALTAEWIESRRNKLHERVKAPLYLSGWRAWLINIESRWLAKRKLKIEKNACVLAAKLLHEAITSSHKVVVERYDRNRSFTLLRPEETHELLQKAKKSTHVWIFVFEPNDLVSKTNASIATLF